MLKSDFPRANGHSVMPTEEATKVAALNDALRQFGEAWASGDTGTLEVLLSPTYTHTDYLGGFQDHAAWLKYAAARTRLNTRVRFRDMRTRIFGDVAIVTGINDVTYMGEQDPAQEDRVIRFTQVWVWRDGRWRREAFQATLSETA